MKLKTFTATSLEELEGKYNTWASENQHNVRMIFHTHVLDNENNSVYTVYIYYIKNILT